MGVPDTLCEHRRGPHYLLVEARFEAAALALDLLEPGGLTRALSRRSGQRGRANTAIVPLPGHPERR